MAKNDIIIPMKETVIIEIRDEFITLGQLLKKADIVSNGGEVKFFLAENKVLVNGEDENRHGKKLYHGDTIEIADVIYKIA